jgi:hypothetical protein
MNLDFLDVLSKPYQKQVGTLGTVGTANNDAGSRVPKSILKVGTVGTDNVTSVPSVPNPRISMGTEILNKDAGVPVVPTVPTVPTENIKSANENGAEPKYDGTCWFVRGKRVTRFPRCPQCHSYALYGPDNRGRFECMTCDLAGFTEATARNYDETPEVVQ